MLNYEYIYLLTHFTTTPNTQFSESKTVVCLTILKRIMDYDAQDELISLSQSFKKFKDLLLLHSCERPPWTSLVFTESDIVLLTDFALNTYFRHHAVYKRIYTKHKVANIQQANVGGLDAPMGSMMPLSNMVELAPVANPEDAENDATSGGESSGQEASDDRHGDNDDVAAQTDENVMVSADGQVIALMRDELVGGLAEDEKAVVLAAAAAIIESRTANNHQQAA
jgi:hypothetical protein